MGKRRRILEVCVNGIGGNEISISGNQKAGGGGEGMLIFLFWRGWELKGVCCIVYRRRLGLAVM